MSRNNVRGPASALTEFLRESGITPTTIARRVATAQPRPVAGPSNLRQSTTQDDAQEDGEETTSSRRRTGTAAASGYVSDDLDGSGQEEPAPKKRKMSKAAQLKLKAKEKGKAKKKSTNDEDEDEDEDTYTALSKSLWTNGSSKPSVGSFENCAKCEKQFTVTKYTIAANPGPGFLCHQCAKSSGMDPFKKAPQPRKRKAPADRRTVVNFEDKRFPNLVSLCIQIISRHIDDVEALGDIGAVNMEHISKAISKNRSLTAQNAPLFYDAQNVNLTFYDATKLESPAFRTLALLNPNLTSLRIDFCGCLDDAAISVWCTSLPCLTRLELLGPFLVRVPAWKSFFESHPRLEGFLITQSPRFNLECIESLIVNCQSLKELRLCEIGKMEDEFAYFLKQSKSGLTYLDLSYPGSSLSEEALVEVLKVVGPTLNHLDLSKHELLTDSFLEEGMKPHVQALTSLNLSHLTELTDEGVAEFFNSWMDVCKPKKPNPPLTSLDLSRNSNLSTNALNAILAHSGEALHYLNINGWKATSEDALSEIAKTAKKLRSLDVGWCREVNDFTIKEVMEECERIKEVKAWGCNRLTASCPRKRGVNIYGIEAHTAL